MRIIFISILGLSVISQMAFSEFNSKVQVPEFTPLIIPLSWQTAEPPSSATTTILYRPFSDKKPVFWQPVPKMSNLHVNSVTVQVKGKLHLQFRTAVKTANESERQVLADFDTTQDFGKIAFVGSQVGFNATLKIEKNDLLGGGMLNASFHYNSKQKNTLKPGTKIGFPFNANMSSTDWSPYHYLEFYYWAEPDDPMSLLIQSATKTLNKPVMDFSEFPKQTGWNSIVINLDKELGKPEDRKAIKIFAFVVSADQLDLKKTYEFHLDSICLWQSRSFAGTKTDPTPPSLITNLRHTIQKNEIVWTWDASKDAESGIAGYAYYWGKNKSKHPPEKVMIDKNEIRLPYADPGYHTFLNFMVKACNKAGLWSDMTMESIEFFPKSKK